MTHTCNSSYSGNRSITRPRQLKKTLSKKIIRARVVVQISLVLIPRPGGNKKYGKMLGKLEEETKNY